MLFDLILLRTAHPKLCKTSQKIRLTARQPIDIVIRYDTPNSC